ncbi:MAG: hypothetical protein AB1925_12660 [Actinomycetota bacterium]
MGRRPMAKTIALRDQIISVLRAEHPMPISTNDVLIKVANEGRNCNSVRTTDGTCHDWTGRWALRDGCPAWCWHSRVYPQLRALTALGLIEQVPMPEMLHAYWRYVETDDDAAMNATLAALEGVSE